MTTETKLNKHLSSLAKGVDLNISFAYKGEVRKALSISQKKGGIIYAVYKDGDEDVQVCVTLDSLVIEKPTPKWEISRQKPKLKALDYVRISTANRRQTAPYLTANMRSYNTTLCKVDSIDNRGFYTLSVVEDISVTASFPTFKWSDKWLKKLTKAECEEELITKPFENLVKEFIKRGDNNIEQLQEQVREKGMQFGAVSRNLHLALKKKNMDKKDLAKEKRDEFVLSLEKIKKDSRINSIDIKLDGVLVRTNPLKYICTDVPLDKRFLFQPAYTFSLNLKTQSAIIKIYEGDKRNPKSEDFHYAIGNSSIHPHISGSGRPCLGNLAPMFQTALSKFDILTATIVLLELMGSYYSGSPYIRADYFYPKADKCENKSCEAISISGRCANCGREKEDVNEKNYLMPIKK